MKARLDLVKEQLELVRIFNPKGWSYEVNLDEYESVGTHWVVLYVNGDKVTYFDSSGVEYTPKEIKKFIGKKIL